MSEDIPVWIQKKVAQLFIIRASGHIFDSEREYPIWELTNKRIKFLLNKGVGGVIFLGGSILELNYKIKLFNSWAINRLLLCADAEEGLGQRFDAANHFVPPMALGKIYKNDPQKAIHLSELYGKFTAQQARSCGLNWILAPVCDVNTNPDNPVINMRAWSQDPLAVSELVCGFYRGLESEKILSCAKHFPGHGDTLIDSHIDLPILNHDLKRLENIELIPFKKIISQGIESIMLGHLFMPALDSINPSTFSERIIKELLRDSLGFDGLVVTDALIMGSISAKHSNDDAALLAFEAGADIIMMPQNPMNSINAISKAIISGRLSIDRLEESLHRRELALNTCLSSINNCVFDQLISDNVIELDNHEILSFSDTLINESIEINEAKISKIKNGINLIRLDDLSLLGKPMSNAPSINFPNLLGFSPVLLYEKGLNLWSSDLYEPLNLDLLGEGPILLQIFFRGKPFLKTRTKNEPWKYAVQQLRKYNRLSGLIVYGCIYLWNELRHEIDQSIPAAYSPGQIIQSQEKLFSRIIDPIDSSVLDSNKDLLADFTD